MQYTIIYLIYITLNHNFKKNKTFFEGRNDNQKPQFTTAERGTVIICQMLKTIRHYFPDFLKRMDMLTDHRKRHAYTVAELVMGCVALFLFKEASRNAINNDRKEEQFRKNYERIFKRRLPHMDTTNDFLCLLSADELEHLKAAMISGLIEQKVLHQFKLLGKYFMVAIDASGINSFKENNKEKDRVHKTSKNGKTTYHSYVLEAKLVTTSGLSVSIASEWIANNAERNFNKQDCEMAALKRISLKLKKYFPRLPICILADGLYPNATFMQTCADNGWQYIAVLKDDSLKTLQTDIIDMENQHRHKTERQALSAKGMHLTTSKYEWISESLTHKSHTIYWLSCTERQEWYCKDKNGSRQLLKEEETRFVWITSLAPDVKTVCQIAEGGRKRWKIENEGFNVQKNNGYALGHLFSRASSTGYKNYYQCLQIAHMINQLTEHSQVVTDLLNSDRKITIKHLWKLLNALLILQMVEIEESAGNPKRCQIRLRKRKGR